MQETTQKIDQSLQGMQSKEGKYLTFALGNEHYGFGILQVREIIGLMDITELPQAPSFLKGIINLRGKVIPVIDLRNKFMMEEIDVTDRTCIIVVEVKGASKVIFMGFLVDSVSEVINVKAEDIEESPALAGNIKTQFILGIAKMDDGMKILLDINKIVDSQEMDSLAQAA